ncbi:MAG TPA: SDR family oxidoreductase [Vicinamibacterales bacterium]|nr:SDR family oxidoreductase [Vicinamibacterales bacterium]
MSTATLVTGATGYVGGHVTAELLRRTADPLALLVRARDRREAEARLWRALQLHLDEAAFEHALRARLTILLGDITEARFGLDPDAYRGLARSIGSIVHIAASLNRRSERACLNVNLRGTLEVVRLACAARDHHGLRRFSHVSTVAVAGHRRDEVVTEDAAIDWDRPDYDPYARTKKFAEHMVRTLLADVPRTIFRPSIILGDSRRPETTQFDMVRAFVFLARLPVLPLRPSDRIDIVPVDFVAESIAAIHLKSDPAHETYHLSSGAGSQTFREITDALAAARGRPRPVYLPALERPFAAAVHALARRRFGALGRGATLLDVFLPYIVWNTVFDNTRVVAETGRTPARFTDYAYPLFRFSTACRFSYPYRERPALERGAA